jgi:uncharacterized membrane protein YfcA
MSSVPLFIALVFSISTLAGMIGSILGLGGGVIVIPALTLGLGVDIRYAIGASIVSVIATSSGAAATYVKDHITNIRVAMLLEVATTVGALSGVLVSAFISTRWLYVVFSVILLYSAYSMGKQNRQNHPPLSRGDKWADRLRLNSSYPDFASGREIAYSVTGVPLGFCLMIGAGLISGLLGIGSGALKVPAMDGAMKIPIKVSSATSNFMIGVTAAASAGAYYMRGDIVPLLAAPVALGVLFGSLFGTRLMMILPAQKIRQLFIFVLVFIALQMGLKSFGVNIR